MTSPFYTDWTFWSFFVAGVAVILSQLPPLKDWRKKARFEVDVYSTLFITHKLGNPNAQLQIGITNTGNRNLKIKEMPLTFERIEPEPGITFTLPAKSHFLLPGDKNPALLGTFRVIPTDEWSHIVCFLNFFNRQDDRTFRSLTNNFRNELARLRLVEPDRQGLYEVTEEFLHPYLEFYRRNFKWESGEYSLTLRMSVDPASASIEKKYRFTLFETDSEQLRLLTEDYKYGAGITWDIPDKATGLFVQIRES